ncbi:MAG: DUF1844 domain-containing protein [Desulfarculaceae bacterium]|nr:DUF1844 domain-containing protein [Desulfarculaceae bacterium]MCF8070846.1 DUF1844 domain-containing protein [Desulfarculaceae bacterium]MCF8102284.1 DUF1844 domain-containing protein [Desulfarculaceae bacterium]MCF8118033.1 DUF1844 domain-containing protein [Desulfarculaceae bacterium]
MSEQEDKGFKVKDRRSFDLEGEARPDAEQEPQAAPEPEKTAATPPPQEPPPMEAEGMDLGQEQEPQAGQRPHLPPVDFSGLILSLAHATMMHLGQIPDPNGQPMPADLELARHTIDTIAMLKEKTEGNLSPEEQKLVETALTELRMAFVQLSR